MGQMFPQSDMVWAEWLACYQSNLPAVNLPLWLHFKENHLLFTGLLYASESMRRARRPLSAHALFAFELGADKEKMRIRRQVRNAAHVPQAALLHRKTAADNPDPLRKASHFTGTIALISAATFLLAAGFLQSESGERIAYRAQSRARLQQKPIHFLPCPLAPHPHPLGQYNAWPTLTHCQQPRSWN